MGRRAWSGQGRLLEDSDIEEEEEEWEEARRRRGRDERKGFEEDEWKWSRRRGVYGREGREGRPREPEHTGCQTLEHVQPMGQSSAIVDPQGQYTHFFAGKQFTGVFSLCSWLLQILRKM